ncbi:MAG: TonB-dependent receptor [Rudaea sp.]|uniref:TonB-dependent receptor domain-containing protein n=1 Tax=Rudaea sp. TaxID=2136325 RepID=UPI0039E3193E
MKQPKLRALTLAFAISCALSLPIHAADEAQAQTSGATTTPKTQTDAAADSTQSLDSVVVTGTATVGGVKKIDAAYNIVSANAAEIKQANPKSTADLLRISPGIWPESSGGQMGANVEVAGFPSGSGTPFFTTQIMGSPLYGMPVLSFMDTTSMFRLDDTTQRVEIVQGGPGVVYGGGQIGATANFILKQGTAEPSGSAAITYGNEGLWRFDGFYGFKLAEGWYGSVGGFWRTSDGVRKTQFPADRGGQLTATLTHDLDNGSFTLYARRLVDRNQFITPIPLLQSGADDFSAYPGFDPLTSTYYGNNLRYFHLAGYPGGGTTVDLGTGSRSAVMSFFGGNFDYDIGGFALSDKFLYNDGELVNRSLFSGTNPKPLSYYLYGCNIAQPTGYCSSANKPNDADTLSLAAGTPVSATYTSGGDVALDQSIIHQGLWYMRKRLKNINNELRLSRELFEGNTLTAGLYLAHYTDADKWTQGNQLLMTNTPNARPFTVSYVLNGVTKYLSDYQGFLDYGTNNLTEGGAANNKALFLSDTWRLDRWLFDASARVENEAAHFLVCQLAKVNLDGDVNTLYDNAMTVCNGKFARTDYDKTHPAFTVGANYRLADNMTVWARATKGPHFGDFDNAMRGFTTGNTPPLQKMQRFEVGYKYQSDLLYADLSAYHIQFSGLTYTLTDGTGVPSKDANGNQLPPAIYGSDSKGLNANLTLTPIENLKLALVGNYMDGHYSHYDACIKYTDINGAAQCAPIDGVQLQRQPKSRFAFTPSYRIPFDWGELSAFVTWTHVGNHTQDLSGLQQLGTYSTVDFGVLASVGKQWQFSLQGTNMTNALGLTESNSRIFGVASSSGGVLLARPIEGREVNVQAKYLF